jgi:hypothetical protein
MKQFVAKFLKSIGYSTEHCKPQVPPGSVRLWGFSGDHCSVVLETDPPRGLILTEYEMGWKVKGQKTYGTKNPSVANENSNNKSAVKAYIENQKQHHADHQLQVEWEPSDEVEEEDRIGIGG